MKTKGLLIITLATLISCWFFGDKVDKEKLPGRYVFQIWGKDTLDVYSNGTYSYHKWWYGKNFKTLGLGLTTRTWEKWTSTISHS